MQLVEAARVMGGEVVGQGDRHFDEVVIDGRLVTRAGLFFAIAGERFDGHTFIPQAVTHGAVAAVVSTDMPQPVPCIRVAAVRPALHQLACHHRDSVQPQVIAVTGSCGKTTVKEMIGCILPVSQTHLTHGNQNNDLGVSLSLLGLRAHHRYAVFELGTSQFGDIAQTVAWVKPQVALINNVAGAHLEALKTLDGVAQAKAEIITGLVEDGVAVFNADDVRLAAMVPQMRQRCISYGLEQPADVTASAISPTAEGGTRCVLAFGEQQHVLTLTVPGRHNLVNALAATACCLALGLPLSQIVPGLAQFSGVASRLSIHRLHNGARVIDDSYNANAYSTCAAIDVLASFDGERMLVLGELAGLGEAQQQSYEEVADHAKHRGIQHLLTCGEAVAHAARCFGEGAQHFEDMIALQAVLPSRLTEESTVLIKGSRLAGMERLVTVLLANAC